MTTEDLKPKAELIKSAFAEIQTKRQLWKDETKPLLQKVLKQIAKDTNYLDLQVQTLDWVTNQEGINLLFNPRPSGLHDNRNPTGLPEPKSFRSYIKHGGYIVFSQAYNGNIFILFNYPYVDEYVTQADIKQLGKYSPELITEQLILEQVSVFFDEMLKWETDGNGANKGIGFNLGR